MSNSTGIENGTTAAPPFLGCDAPTQPWLIVYSIFLVLIMFATLLGNALVVAAVYLFHRLRRVTNFFIVSLAMSDLLVVLITLPLRIDQSVHNFNWCFARTTCAFWVIGDAIFSSASICNLAVISIDRFMAITRPYSYQSKMTKKVGGALIAFVWFYASLWGVLSLINWTDPELETIYVYREDREDGLRKCTKADRVYYIVAMCVAFFLPLVIVIITYSCVFRVAYMQAKAMAALDPHKRERSIVRELKATKMVAIVIGAFIVCWLPFFLVTVLSFCEKCMQPLRDSPALSRFVTIVFVNVLPVLNSCLNPIIYAVFNTEFRVAFKKMLARFLGREQRGNATDEFSVTEFTRCRTNSGASGSSSRAKSLLRLRNHTNKTPV